MSSNKSLEVSSCKECIMMCIEIKIVKATTLQGKSSELLHVMLQNMIQVLKNALTNLLQPRRTSHMTAATDSNSTENEVIYVRGSNKMCT